ncbi:hypothetical protein [Streptosporangium sp. NPDC001681]|uniref:hypothetical protein n=1 Tax=Streptosporangium sp. NPDC001681 TaxID=3154395 RepID=UPI00332C67D5
MTPSRKPSRATVLTASVAIGVFSAGAGLGTVIAVRSDPGGGQVMRLAAGTYLLDDQAKAWSSSASSGSDQPVPLSGADAGSTIAGGARRGDSTDPRVCLTTTTDGHAVEASGEGCVALPVLALAAAAAPLAQRPGNPKSTPIPPPPKTTTAAKPSTPTTNAPAAPKATSAPVQPAPNPGPVQPPAAPPVANPQPVKPPAPPAPTPTERVSGNISQSESESGSVIEHPAEKKVEVVSPPKPAPEAGRTKSSGPSLSSQPQPPGGNKPSQPPGGNRTSQPQPPSGNRTSQPQPTGDNKSQPQPPGGNRTTQPGETAPHTRPTGTLRPAIRSGTGQPIVPSGDVRPPTAPAVVPPATRPTDDAGAPSPRKQPSAPPRTVTPTAAPTAPGGSLKPVQPQPSAGPGENASQGPDGTVLMPATPQLPGGQNGVSLPVFEDPELLRRAYEALGLDRGMRYTDENGVWDLNIAPPGTPPCRNYTAEELQALSTSQGPSPAQSGQTIPRDSCLWPAFIRWLYAEPASGEVSNWTKFTGLPQRNLELVVTDPAPAPLPQPVPDQVQPDPGQPDPAQSLPGHNLPDQPDQGRQVPAQPDPGRLSPAQPGTGDGVPAQWGRGENDRNRTSPFQPDQGQVEPDPVEYDGQ